MTDFNDPNLNRKKKQKLIRIAYEVINDEIREIRDSIKSSSPIAPYISAPDGEKDKQFLENIRTTEQKYREYSSSFAPNGIIDITKFLVSNPANWEKEYNKNMEELIVADKAYNRNIPKSFERKIEAQENICFQLKMVNVKTRREWLQRCIDEGFLSAITLASIKLNIYTGTDALNTDEGRILSDVCIDNDVETLMKLMDEKLDSEYKYDENKENIAKTFCRNDLLELKQLMKIGDPFYVYRGFLVDEDEYVRQGKKSDGADYWKQQGGQGISYSLDKNIAMYFTYWKLTHNDAGELHEYNPKNWIDKIPNSLISFDEYRDAMTQEVWDVREMEVNKGKKPIVCKYLIDPNDIKGFYMGLSEGEVMINPKDICVERYEIVKSKDIAEGIIRWRHKVFYEWNKITAIYRDKGIAVLPRFTDEGDFFTFADAEKINPRLEEIKDIVRDGGDLTYTLQQEIVKLFEDNSLEIPIEEYKINPLYFTEDMMQLLSLNDTLSVKKRIKKVYNWSKSTIEYLQNKVTKS